jgi:hypothetical protein
MLTLTAPQTASGYTVMILNDDGAPAFCIHVPVILEILDGAGFPYRVESTYSRVDALSYGMRGLAEITTEDGSRYHVVDHWNVTPDGITTHRSLTAGDDKSRPVRLLMEAEAAGGRLGFDEAQLFAPPAVYNLNDIDGDGVEDYLDTRTLVFRDDRLTGLAVLAYAHDQALGYALARESPPRYDDVPRRLPGQAHVIQRTDVGALGVAPSEEGAKILLVASYPFVERDRSYALTAEEREPWGAFWPVADVGSLSVSYRFTVHPGASATESLWSLWTERVTRLAPRPVALSASLEELTRLRLEALVSYYAESADPDSSAAGFVTNCHPQDGRQLGNIIQYGFAGQNVLNAHHVLAHAEELSDRGARRKALKVIDFFVAQAQASPFAITPTLYDLDTDRTANWWSGLLLPLAYADKGDDLQALMGPIYDYMRYAIDPLRGLSGTYLRCMAEEHAALLRAYVSERARGHDHTNWLNVSRRFGEFLVAAQHADGSWCRAYDFAGHALTEPAAWFGRTELNQKSSTATAVPFLLGLYDATQDERFLRSAEAAEFFAAERFVKPIKHNGGIHDSIYSRAQLVDSESILYCMRASLMVWQRTGDARALRAATDAARLLATWIYLWDVPLPPSSTYARNGFRSTGWSACDTAGAGYIHPYEINAVPDLLEISGVIGDAVLREVAILTLAGSSETVATATQDWGLARPGLQEEGLMVSWWMIDDPMFTGTGFGDRGKGEGNKTCLPWITAVSVDAVDELVRRFGAIDMEATDPALTDLQLWTLPKIEPGLGQKAVE